jgi:V/A-type H+-transporting ATPase subunit K
MKPGIGGLVVWLVGALLVSTAATLFLWWLPAAAADTAPSGLSSGAVQWGFLAAALATGLSSLGAGYAVAGVGSAAIGALAEKPELLGRALIMVGLAEGIAIYGLIVSILILNRII